MDDEEIEAALELRRFDLEVPEALSILQSLLHRDIASRRRQLELHYEQVETTLDIVRDAFALESVPKRLRDALAWQVRADREVTDTLMVRASMATCLRMLGLGE